VRHAGSVEKTWPSEDFLNFLFFLHLTWVQEKQKKLKIGWGEIFPKLHDFCAKVVEYFPKVGLRGKRDILENFKTYSPSG